MIYMHLLTSFATNNGFIILVEWEGGPVILVQVTVFVFPQYNEIRVVEKINL